MIGQAPCKVLYLTLLSYCTFSRVLGHALAFQPPKNSLPTQISVGLVPQNTLVQNSTITRRHTGYGNLDRSLDTIQSLVWS